MQKLIVVTAANKCPMTDYLSSEYRESNFASSLVEDSGSDVRATKICRWILS